MMKKLLIPSLLLIVIFIPGFAQNLLVANNNPGAVTGTNVFVGTNALRDAITASVDGDVIYVVPSNISYGDININKPLTVFGAGIRPAKELGTRSYVDIVFVDASNVRLSGLISNQDEFRLGWNIGNANIDGIVIENCRTERILMTGTPSSTISNMVIRNNVITGMGSIATHILLNTTSNVIVTNNIMLEGNIGSQPMLKASDVIFSYNLFTDSGDGIEFGAIANCTFRNNIFYGIRVDVAGSISFTQFNYNLSFGNSQDAYHVFDVINNGNSGTGNIESVAGSNDPLFVNFPLVSQWNDAYDASLQASSPALATDPLNLSGEDIGVTGGLTPFDFEANILPLIEALTIPAVIPVGTDLPVTIKAKGN